MKDLFVRLRPTREAAAGSLSRVRSRRLGTVVTLVVLAAAGGWVAGRGIESPGEAARRAQAPAASPVTVPVQHRVITNAVVVRGDVTFAEEYRLAVDPDLGDGSLGQLVLTGRIPTAGAQLGEGAVAIEVSGRPVILLQGTLPMYRGLRPGLRGEDVRQLESALRRLGHFSGTPNAVYDEITAAAVRRLYDAVGYPAIGPSVDERSRLAAADGQVSAARVAQRAAADALAAALRGPPQSAVLAAQGAVEQARLARDQARDDYQEALASGAPADELAALSAALAAAENQLAVAEAQLAELTAVPDTTELRRRLDEATADVRAAEAARAELAATIGFRVPRGEVAFVPSLPRQVGPVDVKAGDPPSTAVLRLTATTLQVDISLSAEERGLVAVGDEVRLDDAGAGVDLAGVVAFVADTPGTNGVLPGRFYARVEPRVTGTQQLNGLNLRVSIPIESTGGPVLAVPVAALVTDAAGNVTVRIRRGAGQGDVDVAVTVGLTADGFAQVTPVGGDLAEGDLVIVGHQW